MPCSPQESSRSHPHRSPLPPTTTHPYPFQPSQLVLQLEQELVRQLAAQLVLQSASELVPQSEMEWHGGDDDDDDGGSDGGGGGACRGGDGEECPSQPS